MVNKENEFKFRFLEYTLNLKHFSTSTLLFPNFKVQQGVINYSMTI